MARWDGIEECVAVAETRSFTRAAERLGSSVANISRQISRLEDRLDVQLFQRTTRSVTLTDDGRIYYNHCRALLDGLVEAEQAIGERLSEPTGRLRITAPLSYGERYIAPLIAGFTMHYPRVEIDLQLTNQRLDLIESGIDLAIRVGVLEDERLVARPLAHRAQFVCASPDYLARYGQPHTLAELKNHSCLLGTLDHWRFTDQGERRDIRVTGRLRCNSGPALRDAALKGLGIVQLPDYYVKEDIQAGRLVTVLDAFAPAEEGVWALYPPNRHLSPKVRACIEWLGRGLKVGVAANEQ
ncbi:MAG: LysR substrate-binding domain-containing protein [Oceanisphaera sp.]|nr:LysR substrate-binding domain-containing protein [Oceanisphaera sp.]